MLDHGKTAVSIIAAYKAVKSGYQVAVMAPTAILSKQHLKNFEEILSNFNIKCELLVSGISKKQKEDILKRLSNGEIDVLIGTHSLLEENVVFKNLGLVVTDEQHRDLDISIIDELPPNRKKIDTFAVSKGMEDRVNGFIKKQLDEGRQCYIVCPLVEESEEIDAKAVLNVYKKYKEEFSNYRVEYIHGKLRPKEKDQIMQEFKDGKIDILISTTVIEVGVDVPNSNIMVIENAERFGLATLHQLRGRVGRGEYKSYCILKYEGKRKKYKRENENNVSNKQWICYF